MKSEPDLFNRAVALHKKGQLDEARAIYESLLAAYPSNSAVIFTLLGQMSFQQGKWLEGIAWMDKVIANKPNYAPAHYDRGLAMLMLGNFSDAVASCDKAIALKPDFTDAYSNRGNALQQMNRYEDALLSYQKAMALNPDFANAYANQGKALHELKRYDEALISYDKAIALNPDDSQAYLNKGMLKLLLGEFKEGWQLYEWRWKKNRQDDGALLDKPLWRGQQDLTGKTILLHSEQGLGDTIQCCRYIPLVEALGAKVLLIVPFVLQELVSTLNASYQLVTEKFAGDFDLHCMLYNLPMAFGTQLNNIPDTVPYLFSNQAKVTAWQQRLGKKIKPRIGLVWSGSVTNTKDRNRNVPLNLLLPLLKNHFEYHCLQKEIKAEDETLLKQAHHVVTHTSDLNDFSDTAALLSEMDLVITVDTSVAHLAGAIGKPVWVMLPFLPDFRWMKDRSDSPWYPTARLFRQTEIGEWNNVIAEIDAALKTNF